jgi:PAS domain S-box-containing protein
MNKSIDQELVEEIEKLKKEKVEYKQEIEKLREFKEKLNAIEERYALATRAAAVGVWDWNVETNEFYLDANVKEILGYSDGEIPNDLELWSTYVHPDDKQSVMDAFQAHIDGLTPEFVFEHRMNHKDGSIRWIMARGTAIRDARGNPIRVVGTDTDITQRKLAEEALRESEEKLARSNKMKSLGLMAGGIAHDLNNILSGIVSYPDIILADLPQDSPLRIPIETMKESGLRSAAVVSDLLTIARGVTTGKEVGNLNTIVGEYVNCGEHKIFEAMHPSVTFITRLDPDLLNTRCSATHIKKCLMNLVTNASEAIEDHGTVAISTSNQYLDVALKGYEDVSKGEYVLLSVSDDGSGISPEDLEKIFEPFFTKKVMGRSGTGLGLTVVWNTVQDHGGYINVRSGEGGTVLELYFPVCRDEVSNEKKEISIEEYLGHGENILVVDDEKNQREIAYHLLTRLGYSAAAVSSGEESIEYLKKHSADLIILDMIMPKGINGRETYERIVKIHPKQRAIIASGFAETEDVNAIRKLGAGTYIKKPYTLEKIGLAIKKELDELATIEADI